uniref:Uncharacterized protein n=1 Tax=Helianthus annuus TaxID=4232 RepID=A0A251VDG3_HELAN
MVLESTRNVFFCGHKYRYIFIFVLDPVVKLPNAATCPCRYGRYGGTRIFPIFVLYPPEYSFPFYRFFHSYSPFHRSFSVSAITEEEKPLPENPYRWNNYHHCNSVSVDLEPSTVSIHY